MPFRHYAIISITPAYFAIFADYFAIDTPLFRFCLAIDADATR
jgi:hypothetical protein